MSRNRCLLLASLISALLAGESPPRLALAADPGPASSAAPGPALQTAPGPSPQIAPDINLPPSKARRFEPPHPVKALAGAIADQWRPTTSEIPPESIINPAYFRRIDNAMRKLGLKEAVYIALINNPNVKAAALTPLGATEGVAFQNAIFDPDLLSTADTLKTVIPATVGFETRGGGDALSTKSYDWNFTINKILAQSNGTLSLSFTNDRTLTNNSTEAVNPFYIPTLAVSLSQPLLRNFGWKFATINVRLAESAQRQAQWNYAQALTDFVQRVANDYWSVVGAEENLRVAEEALKFNGDLVRVNRISVQVGTLAPIDLREAQSADATARANVYTAQAALKTARATLREDVMLNPNGAFVPQNIEPSERPNPAEPVALDERAALVEAVEQRPSLGAMREAIRTALLQARFQENQILPQVNAQAQIATTSMTGNALCGPTFGVVPPNCVTPSGPGFELPFQGGYDSALNRLFNFSFYNYVAIFSFERPLANASANAALAQARIGLEQIRQQYRAVLAQAVVAVQSALANAEADIQRARATAAATAYARQALHDEQVRFRVGMATTHDLLQFQSEEVTAEGNQVQAEIDLENAKLALRRATGTLLRSFQVNFELQRPDVTPWYAHM